MVMVRRKNVAVLFSGGDAPGMNALLRAFVRLGHNRCGAEILGINGGYGGSVLACQQLFRGELPAEELQYLLIDRRGRFGLSRLDQDLVWLDCASVSGIARRWGIILGCARCPEFFDREQRRQVSDLLDDLRIYALVACGGEGTMAGAQCLAAESSLQVLGIRATIDNDVPGTSQGEFEWPSISLNIPADWTARCANPPLPSP